MNPTPNQTLTRCRDCAHWMRSSVSYEKDYPRDLDPRNGYWTNRCMELRYGIDIDVSGGWNGATVDGVSTDANFACIYGQPKP